MPRAAVIGPQIVKAVDEKTKTGMNRSQAFAAVAQERGSRPGSVAANYYRMQRKQNPQALRRQRTRKGSRSTPATAAASRATATQARRSQVSRTLRRRSAAPGGAVDIDRLANDLVAAVNALAAAVTAQQRETQLLQARLNEARSALR